MNLSTGHWVCFSANCGESGSLHWFLYKLGLRREQVDRELSGIQFAEKKTSRQQLAALRKEPEYIPEYVLGAYDACPKSLLDAGFDIDLLSRHDVGFDRGHSRITFPIRDYLGRLAAISGRATEDWMIPRYKVYEKSDLGDSVSPGYVPENRRHLYGFHDVFPSRFYSTDETHPLLIVEGFKACLWCRQGGLPHTVALMGSSLSPPQRMLLHRLKGPYYIMLDHEPGKNRPDGYGRCASIRIAEHLSSAGRVHICDYPTGKPDGTSPDDLTKEELATAIKDAVTPSQIVIKYPTTPKVSYRGVK